MNNLIRSAILSTFGQTGSADPTAEPDPYFKYNTLLLHGNGTNGAQNASFVDSSSNNFSITPNGNVTQGTFSPFSQSQNYWSTYFNGANDNVTESSQITFPANAAFNFGSGAFTIEGWVFCWPRHIGFIIGNSAYGGNAGWSIWQYSATSSQNPTTKLSLLWNGVAYVKESTNSMIANQWNHIAVSKSGSNVYIFINGTLSDTFTDGPTINDSAAAVGFGQTTSWNAPYCFRGYLSNFRVTKGGALYTSSFTPSTTPLTTTVSSGTVSLLTHQSNRFVDNSVNNFTPTVLRSPSIQPFSPFTPTAAYSKSTVGGSAYSDGSGDYLSCSTTQIIPSTADFTLEAWFYPTSLDSYPTLINQGTAGTSGRLRLFVNPDGTVALQITGSTVTSSATVKINQWNYIAATRSGSSVSVYVNGAAAATGTLSDAVQNTSLNIGYDWESPGYGQITGYVSSVRISTSIRSSLTTFPTSPFANDANAKLLLNITDAGIIDRDSRQCTD